MTYHNDSPDDLDDNYIERDNEDRYYDLEFLNDDEY